jgi:nitrate reductase delta subunit
METLNLKKVCARAVFIRFAELLAYPECDFDSKIHCCREEFVKSHDASNDFLEFTLLACEFSTEELEEIYTRTFEITPSCVPYVSIHLFGEENFKRGEFMARLKQRYDELGFDIGNELPDHLIVLLRFISVAEHDEIRDLLKFCVLTPLQKMIASLDEANPYRYLLLALKAAFKKEYPEIEGVPTPLEEMYKNGPVACGLVSNSCGCGSATSPNTSREEMLLTHPK